MTLRKGGPMGLRTGTLPTDSLSFLVEMVGEGGPETAVHEGRSITRERGDSTGFGPSPPDGMGLEVTGNEEALGNWWETKSGGMSEKASRKSLRTRVR
jgi:hypothetical protein